MLQQQNEFIDQNEKEIQKKSVFETKVKQLNDKLNEAGRKNKQDLLDKDYKIEELEEQLQFKK